MKKTLMTMMAINFTFSSIFANETDEINNEEKEPELKPYQFYLENKMLGIHQVFKTGGPLYFVRYEADDPNPQMGDIIICSAIYKKVNGKLGEIVVSGIVTNPGDQWGWCMYPLSIGYLKPYELYYMVYEERVTKGQDEEDIKYIQQCRDGSYQQAIFSGEARLSGELYPTKAEIKRGPMINSPRILQRLKGLLDQGKAKLKAC